MKKAIDVYKYYYSLYRAMNVGYVKSAYKAVRKVML